MPEMWRKFEALEMDALAPPRQASWPWRFFRRVAVYLVAGAIFFLAFASPLNFTPGLIFTFGGRGAPWYEWLGILVAGSLASGLAIEYLVVQRFHYGILALAYLSTMAIFVTFLSGLADWLRNYGLPSAPDLFAMMGTSVAYGIFGTIPCFHLVFPISFLVAAEAARTAEEGWGV